MAKFDLIALLFTLLIILVSTARPTSNRQLEKTLMAKYERRHRPVKRESTTTTVKAFIVINHIEEVNQDEQTMIVHGMLWAQWKDEYLTWDPKNWSNVDMITIQPWKIWQPAFALYNSAKTNSWYLYMNGQPATVTSTGKVSAIGAFTFHVTCSFDFTHFPYDVQKCPIVIADWVYDLSKVNLTNTGILPRPVIRLSTNPFGGTPKRHVAGWEIVGSWQSQCNYGPNGCEKLYPDGPVYSMYQLDNYWSLLEFGITIKRHAPYFFVTVTMPMLTSVFLSLVVFWIEDISQAALISLFSLFIHCFAGWSMVKQIPPGNGTMPDILRFYAVMFFWNAFVFFFHATLSYLQEVLPEDIEFPFKVTNWSEYLRQWKAFNSEGFSFDPQTFLLYGENSQRSESITTENLVENEVLNPNGIENALFEMDPIDQAAPTTSSKSTYSSAETESVDNRASYIDIPGGSVSQPSEGKKSKSHLEEELYTLRRAVFFVFAIFAVIMALIFLI